MLTTLSSHRAARRAAILSAAREAFLDRGFLRTTLEDITRKAGGSRATIYAEFGSKEGLLAAIVSEVLASVLATPIFDGPPEVVLQSLAHAYMAKLMAPDSLAMYRMVVGECAHLRDLGRAVFAAGPEAGAQVLADYLRRAAVAGDLRIADPDRAARQFIGMVEGDLHRRALMWDRAPTQEEVDVNISLAVTLFLDGSRPSGMPT